MYLSPVRTAQTTIKDIASRLGVSPSTVSRALKDHPDISKDTKEAVKKLAVELKYNPNAIALSLRHSKSNTIGLIIPEIVHYFFSSVISGIEDIAYEAGYNVIICQSNESYEREVMSTNALLASRVEGLLASISKTTLNYNHFLNLSSMNIPVVFFDRICPVMQTDRVIIDDFEGGYKATEHLINKGCKKIAHLYAPQHLDIGKNRLDGYIAALKKSGLSVDDELILKADDHDEGYQTIKKLLDTGKKFDGVFAVNDNAASGSMLAIKQKGLSIPDDIAVLGFSNTLIAKVTEPALTSVEQFGYEMGKKATQLLFNRLNSIDDYPMITEVLKTEIVERESTNRKTQL